MLDFIQNQLFFSILNMSCTGGVVVLAVVLARLALRRAPKMWAYVLWGVVLFRLLCPVSLSGAFSLLGALQAPAVENTGGVGSVVTYVEPNRTRSDEEPAPSSDFDAPQISQPEDVNENVPILGPVPQEPEPAGITLFRAASLVWLVGVTAMVAYALVSYVRLRRRLREAVRLEGKLYLCEQIDSPFVLGLIRPKIYLPVSLKQEEMPYILLHERHHIRRGDPMWRMLAYLALCLHWFNPLVWLAFVLSGRDMEMSCDEAVLKKLGGYIRADYSASLLSLSTGRTLISGTPLAFGEGDTKQRIHNLLRWRKPSIWLTGAAVVLCLAVTVACAVNPRNAAQPSASTPDPVQSQRQESIVGTQLVEHVVHEVFLNFSFSDEHSLTAPLRVSMRVPEDWKFQDDTFAFCTQGEGNAFCMKVEMVGEISEDYELDRGFWEEFRRTGVMHSQSDTWPCQEYTTEQGYDCILLMREEEGNQGFYACVRIAPTYALVFSVFDEDATVAWEILNSIQLL